MEMTMKVKARVAKALCLFMISFAVHSPCGARVCEPFQTVQPRHTPQTETDEDERGVIRAKEFIGSRPGGSNPHPGRYRSRQRLPRGRSFANVGVTIGRGRPATEAEITDHKVAKVRSSDGVEHVLERISDDTTVTDGTRMQIIIEYLAHNNASGRTLSNQVGYLYVINREQYPNRKYGPPSLIFPTRRTYGGDSYVLPGKTVTLPAPDRLWRVSRSKSRTAQAFETYIIIISPRPLRDSSGLELKRDNLGLGSRKLEEKLVAGWVRQWGGGEWRGDLENGAGQLITQREHEASGDPERDERTTDEESSDLAKDDAPPQIVFRRVLSPAGTLLVTIKLPFKDTASATVTKP
jgi:hypothetical protein